MMKKKTKIKRKHTQELKSKIKIENEAKSSNEGSLEEVSDNKGDISEAIIETADGQDPQIDAGGQFNKDSEGIEQSNKS